MKSIWNDVKKPEINALYGDIKTDVLIIGGGICGILCAYMLENAGVECVLVEQNEICSGVTNMTTAKLTVQHGLIYDKIIKKYGVETAQLYYESQKSAFDDIKKIALETDADFEECDSFVYSLNNKKVVEDEVRALNNIGCRAEFCIETELPFDIAGAVKIANQAKFHPLKLTYELAKELTIFENTKVLEIKSNTAITNRGKIKAKKIIVATHFPFINRYGGYFMKMYQHRSYVLALENIPEIKGMYVDESMKGLSFRNYGNILLLGGGSHRTGNKGGGWAVLEKYSKEFYPEANIVGKWATQDCMSLDSVPYIGLYSKSTPDLYVATGFNKWGMTSSMVAATLLRDLICNKENKFKNVYLPSRTILHPQLAVNMFESAKNLVTPTVPRCSHLGCALKYNKQEHTWDCPCHGSSFDEKGKVIYNPAMKEIDI